MTYIAITHVVHVIILKIGQFRVFLILRYSLITYVKYFKSL